jgi:ribonuclease D
MAAVRELWTTRDHIARRRDIAPGRILPDSAIISAATADPKTVEELTALPVFGGSKQRRSAAVWLDALSRARDDKSQPEVSEPQNGPPPASRWARRKPEAAARLEAARAGLAALSERLSVPTENLVTPEVVRRLCWDWQPSADTEAAVEEFLRDAQARQWQRELVVPVLAAALTTPAQ